MKSILIVCVALLFVGCSKNDELVKVIEIGHDVLKNRYNSGAKDLFTKDVQNKLEAYSHGVDEYGDTRKVFKTLVKDRIKDVNTTD